jgi:hypothetical protein
MKLCWSIDGTNRKPRALRLRLRQQNQAPMAQRPLLQRCRPSPSSRA